jgi:transketolase
MSNDFSEDIQTKAVNTLRFLSADTVQEANSGHPGLPMGAAGIVYALWTQHLKYNPDDPAWPDRDRFILSGGHGSALLYSILHLAGYDLSIDELKNFRQWGSKTPGHPEYKLTPGVEVTTGPLGQGFANGVGMAIAAQNLGARFNKSEINVVDHFIYALVTDGDLMEGVASEAASLAGHLQLGRLIYLYDDNNISIDGSTDLAFTEDRHQRFEAYGWHTQTVEDGNDVNAIDSAIGIAKTDPRPSLISVQTIIGYGLPTKQGTAKAHGEPAGEEELDAAKEELGWPTSPRFYIPEDIREHFMAAGKQGAAEQQGWVNRIETYKKLFSKDADELLRRLNGELPDGWENSFTEFEADQKGVATRNASGRVLNSLAEVLPELIGGSADLAPSNKTWINDMPSFQVGNRTGRNFHFGVREHAMGSIANGIAVHGGFIPYAGTFLVFSDYMRPAIRLSALSGYPCIWIFTHDSIGLGEDGPTHQPVEQLMSLRTIPDLTVIRPADANETSEAWKIAVENRNSPTALILTRQNLKVIDRKKYESASRIHNGAYILGDTGPRPEIILMASGSEVELILEAGEILISEGIQSRLVSFPSWELFNKQSQDYKKSVFPEDIKSRISVEAGVSLGWEKWIGDNGISISVDHYGASAPYEVLYKEYGLTVERIVESARTLLSS